jgi:hypothetical protein
VRGRRWQEKLTDRWARRQAGRPDGRLPARLAGGFVISLVTVAVPLGVVLPAVGWFWTVVLILTYSVNAWCVSDGLQAARKDG